MRSVGCEVVQYGAGTSGTSVCTWARPLYSLMIDLWSDTTRPTLVVKNAPMPAKYAGCILQANQGMQRLGAGRLLINGSYATPMRGLEVIKICVGRDGPRKGGYWVLSGDTSPGLEASRPGRNGR